MLSTKSRPVSVHKTSMQDCGDDSQLTGIERRLFPRYLLKIPVVCAELNGNLQQTSEFISARTLNVSVGGLLLVTSQILVSDRISVTFCDRNGTPFDLTARVIHRNSNGTRFFTGVEFFPAAHQSEYAKKLVQIALNSDSPASRNG